MQLGGAPFDPFGIESGINTYSNVGGNPLGYFDPYGLSSLTIRNSDGQIVIIENPTGQGLIDAVNSTADGSISLLQISGHGSVVSQCISRGDNCADELTPKLDVESNGRIIGGPKDILGKKMSVAGQVRLEGCTNASGDSNLTRSIIEILRDIPVTGGEWISACSVHALEMQDSLKSYEWEVKR